MNCAAQHHKCKSIELVERERCKLVGEETALLYDAKLKINETHAKSVRFKKTTVGISLKGQEKFQKLFFFTCLSKNRTRLHNF